MSAIRVGWGFDAHRFGGEPPLLLGGAVASSERGVEATSDGDLVTHAVIDALSDLGVTHIDMPVSPGRVWAAIQAAKH